MITFKGQKLEAFKSIDAFDFLHNIPGKAPVQKILDVFAQYEREWNEKCDPGVYQVYFRGRTFYINGGVPHVYKSGIVFSLEGNSMDHYFISTVGMAEAFISGVKWKENLLSLKYDADYVGYENDKVHGRLIVEMKDVRAESFIVLEECIIAKEDVQEFPTEQEALAFISGAYAGYGGTSALMSEESLKEANDFS